MRFMAKLLLMGSLMGSTVYGMDSVEEDDPRNPSTVINITPDSRMPRRADNATGGLQPSNQPIIHATVPTTQTPLPITQAVDLNEDVPGCVDDYSRCCIGFWRVAEGWFDFTAYATTSSGVFVLGLATKGNFDAATTSSLGTVGLVLGGVGLFLTGFKSYSTSAIERHRKTLSQVVLQSHSNLFSPTIANQ